MCAGRVVGHRRSADGPHLLPEHAHWADRLGAAEGRRPVISALELPVVSHGRHHKIGKCSPTVLLKPPRAQIPHGCGQRGLRPRIRWTRSAMHSHIFHTPTHAHAHVVNANFAFALLRWRSTHAEWCTYMVLVMYVCIQCASVIFVRHILAFVKL